jgi:polysaccharide export outer membrane protein
MRIEKKLALPVVIILLAGLGLVFPTRAQGQGSAWESTSKKGKAKGSSAVVAREIAPGPAPAGASVPLVNPNEYIVGEADLLHIGVWKEPELSQNVVVRPDGKISLALMNEVKVSGQTPTQIQTMLTARLKAFIVDPQVTVTVSDVRSKNAFITGEVARPGAYPLLMPTNVLQLIAKAGGFTPFALHRGIVVLREVNGKQVRIPFPYKDVIRGQKDDQNIELRPGDTVVVP